MLLFLVSYPSENIDLLKLCVVAEFSSDENTSGGASDSENGDVSGDAADDDPACAAGDGGAPVRTTIPSPTATTGITTSSTSSMYRRNNITITIGIISIPVTTKPVFSPTIAVGKIPTIVEIKNISINRWTLVFTVYSISLETTM
ncbi:hypothetical protein AX774_g2911 [Zancudomyces culisetae]|uniref:Uncharacterized protein n=1 Tax=Zancudomyces culisetae TaxID=1213189 RepID=A0A1R1PRR5_ZANCU|nr:hypothetical protein AX774_g2911 [Zancudomyces culisetae]|eukprot:OMH83583.1 hypothetical protein AX774_g2911 [Zancudomyces culisetae]